MALVLTTDLSTLRDTLNSALNGTGVGGGYNQSHTVASNPAAVSYTHLTLPTTEAV